MSVLFVDGWDYGDALHMGGQVSPFFPTCKYVSYNRINVTVQPGRVSASSAGGGNSVNLGNSGFGQQTFTKIFPGSNPTYCAGFAFKAAVITIPMSVIFRYEAGGATVPGPLGGGNSSTALMLAIKQTDSTISVYTGADGIWSSPGTLLWNSSGTYTYPLNQWVYFELQVDTGTGNWAVFADDVLLQSGTSGLIPAGIDRYSHIQHGFEDHNIDDHYCSDGAQLGPCRVTGFPPSTDAIAGWVPAAGASHVAMVGEFGNRAGLNTPDNLDTYVQSNAAPQTDTFNFVSPACYGRILALALNVDALQISPTTAANLITRRGGTIYTIGTTPSFTSDFLIYQVVSSTSPVTGTFWDDPEIAATQFGYVSAGSGISDVTQFFLEKLVSLRNVPFRCAGGNYSFTQPG